MNLKFSFSWVGLLIFALPMFINIAYALFPPAGEAVPPAPAKRWVESIEKVSRMAYLAAVVLLVSRDPLSFRSAWLYMGLAFLALFCGRAGYCAAESPVFICADAPGGVSGAVLSVRRPMAAQSSGCRAYGDLRCGAFGGVDPVLSLKKCECKNDRRSFS